MIRKIKVLVKIILFLTKKPPFLQIFIKSMKTFFEYC